MNTLYLWLNSDGVAGLLDTDGTRPVSIPDAKTTTVNGLSAYPRLTIVHDPTITQEQIVGAILDLMDTTAEEMEE